MFYLSYQDYLLKVFLKVFAETKSYVGDRETTWQEFVKTILKENKTRGLTLSDFKTYYKATSSQKSMVLA